jgi:hypothetical protein
MTSKAKLESLDMDEYLIGCVTVDVQSVTDEYIRLPADLAYWNTILSRQILQYERAKANLRESEARANLEVRERLIESGAKVTEAVVDARTQLEPALKLARLAYADAVSERKRLEGLVSAINSKREMLISLGATLRKEYVPEPSISNDSDDNW